MENSPKKSFIHDIVDGLTKDNIPQKILQPCVDYVKEIIKPYYIIHIVIQLIVICLLLLILYNLKY
jgi:hypothetical protein